MPLKTILPILALVFIAACSKDKKVVATPSNPYPGIEKVNDSFVVYDIEDYQKIWLKNRDAKIKSIDTFCPSEKKRAEQDIKSGKRIYFVNIFTPATEGLKSLLKKHGIEGREALYSCIRLGSFELYCYQNTMNTYIEENYGTNFIDSLTDISKREYILQHPDEPYMEDGRDLRDKYLKK